MPTATASQLPNGRTQFLDKNGDPLVGGEVGHYVPTTLIAKDTWQDPYQTTLNDNPLTLDALGSAAIWGAGLYRQILKDAAGNTLWDVPTLAPQTVGNSQAVYYDTLAQAEAATIPAGTTSVVLLGYYAAADGGGAQYTLATGPSGPGKFESADGQWWQIVPVNGALSVLAFGATGQGVLLTDESVFFQGGFDFLHSAAGGDLIVPSTNAFYNFLNAAIPRNNVRLVGTGEGATIKNTNSGSTQNVGLPGTVLLPGNFHPAYTQNFAVFGSGSTYYNLNAVAQGNSVTCTTAGQAANFTVGDQVFVTSTGYTTTGGFGLADYAWLNVVTGVNAGTGVVSLKYPIDVAMSAGLICRLASNLGRNSIPLFFWEDGAVINLNLSNQGLSYPPSSGPASDSACKNVLWQDTTMTSAFCWSINCQQDCQFVRTSSYWGENCLELALNSLRCRVESPRWYYELFAGTTPIGPATLHEHSRDCVVDDDQIVLAAGNVTAGYLYTLTDGQRNAFRGGQASGAGGNFPMCLVNSDPPAGTSAFHSIDQKIVGLDMKMDQALTWAILDGENDPLAYDNGFEDCRFDGVCTSPANAFIARDVVSRDFLEGNKVNSGQMQSQLVSASAFTGLRNRNNYYDNGFASLVTSAEFSQNECFGNDSAASIAAQQAKMYLGPAINIPADTPTVVYTAPLDQINGTCTGSISGTTLTVTGTPTSPLKPGLVITGAEVTAGSEIVAFGTGIGGAGTYTLSNSMTVSSETLTIVQENVTQYSTIDLRSTLFKNGTTDAGTVVIALYDTGTSTEIDVYSFTISAANGTSYVYQLEAEISWSDGLIVGTVTMNVGLAGNITPAVAYIFHAWQVETGAAQLRVKMGTGGSTDAMAVQTLVASWNDPHYLRAA